MKLKGDLTAIGLAELLETLSAHRSTGTLSVRSFMGEKHVAFASGEITVFSDPLGERARLGELLIVQGRLSREKLDQALRLQSVAETRELLGDVLIKQKFLSEQEVVEAVKFQIVEEICDLLTWKDASFEFDGSRTAEELAGDSTLLSHSLAIDPQLILLEATRRVEEWKEIGTRLPTPYLCFKVTPRGEEAMRLAQPTTQRIIKLLREGRTLETVVKLSCLGRFAVSKSVIRFLDEGWLLPYPAKDLRALAGEHCVQGRYPDALNVYRRLLEVSETDQEREELTGLIEDTTRALRKARAAGRPHESAATLVSHKAAAAAYQHRKRLLRISAATVALTLFLAGLVYVFMVVLDREDPSAAAYQSVKDGAEKAVAEERFQEAEDLWKRFLSGLQDPQGLAAQQARVNLELTQARRQTWVERRFSAAQEAERNREYRKAEDLYAELAGKHGHLPRGAEAARSLDSLRRLRDRKDLEEALQNARAIETARQFASAREKYRDVSEKASAGSEARRGAEEGLARLAAMEERARAAFQKALALLQERKGEEALAQFSAAQAEWPELEAAREARARAAELRLTLEALRSEVRAAQELGFSLRAIPKWREILARGEFEKFEAYRQAKGQCESLETRTREIEELLNKALTAFRKSAPPDVVRPLFEQLLKEGREYLAARQVRLPARLTSRPPGAGVRLNDQRLGLTPLTAELPADGAFTLRIELDGYAPLEWKIQSLTASDLFISVNLERAFQKVALPGPSFFAPLLLKGRWLAGAGGALTACDPGEAKVLWKTAALVGADAPAPADPALLNADKATWPYLRIPPQDLGGGNLLVVTRLPEVLEVKAADGAVRTLLRLPAPPVGAAAVIQDDQDPGRSLAVFACADGKLRAYSPAAPEAEKWSARFSSAEAPVLPAGGVLIAGGLLVVAARDGALTAFRPASGEQVWSQKMKSRIEYAAHSVSASSSDRALLTAFVTVQGAVLAVDLRDGNLLWETTPEPGDRALYATPAPRGVFVISQAGTLKCFARTQPAGREPAPAWSFSLLGAGPPAAAEGDLVYVAAASGHLHALVAVNGREFWRAKCDSKPLHLSVHGQWVSVSTTGNELAVLKTE